MTTLAKNKAIIGPDGVRRIVLPLVIALVACCWLLPSLGNGMLWQDEAQTALLGRTTLRHGVPIAFDGFNSISQENGDDYGPHGLWKWHMWLPFYVLAGFFKVFGESTAVARLPFALLGVATVVLAYFTVQLLWRDWRVAVTTCALVLACVPFVILARQCRYYSFCMFFSLLMLDGYLRICRGSRRAWIELCLAGVLLFNSHFLYCATAWGAIGLNAAIWHRNRWRSLLLAAVVTGVLCIPPVLWLASLNYRNYSHRVINLHFARFQLRTYFHETFRWIVPYPLAILALILVIGFFSKKRPLPSKADLEPWAWPIFFATFTIVGCMPFTPWPFFRYIGPIIVPLMMLVARMVVLAFRMNLFLGCASVALLGIWWPIVSHVREMVHPFIGPTEGVVALLHEQAKPGDVVVASYEDLALKFYTPYQIVGGWTGQPLTPGEHARWLVVRQNPVNDQEAPVQRFISDQLKKYGDYRAIQLSAPDTTYENREDPEDHRYTTAKKVRPLVVERREDRDSRDVSN